MFIHERYFPFRGVIDSNGTSREIFQWRKHYPVEKALTPQRHRDSQTILGLFIMRKRNLEKRRGRLKPGEENLPVATMTLHPQVAQGGKELEIPRDISDDALPLSICLTTDYIATVQRNYNYKNQEDL